MQQNKFNRISLLAAAIVLSLVIVASCGSARKSAGKSAEQNQEQLDTAKVTPTHPPVVVPHTWREEMDKK